MYTNINNSFNFYHQAITVRRTIIKASTSQQRQWWQ